MPYFLSADNFKNNEILILDESVSSNRFLLRNPDKIIDPIFIFSVNRRVEQISKYDYLSSTAMAPIFSHKINAFSKTINRDSILIPVKIICLDGVLTNYSITHIISRDSIIDYEKSEYTPIADTKNVMSMKKYAILDCFIDKKIWRDCLWKSQVFVSDDLAESLKSFKGAKLTKL